MEDRPKRFLSSIKLQQLHGRTPSESVVMDLILPVHCHCLSFYFTAGISATDSNTGPVVGGTIGGLLAITVIVVIGIFVLRRGKGFPGKWHEIVCVSEFC